MNKSPKSTKIIFTIAGLIMLCGAIFWWVTTIQFINQSTQTEGTVIEFYKQRNSGRTRYAPTIKYTTKNNQEIEFVSKVSSRSPNYTVGQTVPLIYDPEKPHKASINSITELWLGPIIITFLALAFLLTGGISLAIGMKRTKEITRLKQFGMPVKGKIIGSEQRAYKVNNKRPYRFKVQINQNGQTSTFKSDNIWFNPGNTYNNKDISVFIDPSNSKKYYVALEELDQKLTA